MIFLPNFGKSFWGHVTIISTRKHIIIEDQDHCPWLSPRYGNDVSGEGAEAEAGDGKRNEAELENIEKSLLSLFPRGDIFVFSWPCSLLLLKSSCFISTTFLVVFRPRYLIVQDINIGSGQRNIAPLSFRVKTGLIWTFSISFLYHFMNIFILKQTIGSCWKDLSSTSIDCF